MRERERERERETSEIQRQGFVSTRMKRSDLTYFSSTRYKSVFYFPLIKGSKTELERIFKTICFYFESALANKQF